MKIRDQLARQAEQSVQQAPPIDVAQSPVRAEQVESQVTQDEPPTELKAPEEPAEIVESAPAPVQEVSTVTKTVSEETEPDAPLETVPVEAPEEQEQEPVAAQNLSEEPTQIENSVSAESATIPKLTVTPKKNTTTESVPLGVVTLQSDSKKKPDQLEAAASPVKPETAPRQPASSAPQEVQPPATVEKQDEPAAVVREPERVASIDATLENDRGPLPTGPNRQAETKDSGAYFAQRLAAGSRWLVGGSKNKYTVQLMVLDSKDAQQNVRYMLSEEDYRPIIDKLYILRKSGQPQTVMLYWGEFDSPAEARQAKDQLPNFLSRLEPFEIPVKDAVAKARAGQ